MSFKFKPKLIIATVFVLSLAFAVQSFAQDTGAPNILQNYKDLYQSKQPALENWTNSNGEANVVMGVNLIADVVSMPDELLQGQTYTKDGKKIVWIPGGALGSTTNMIAALNQTPASGIQYIAQIKDSFLGKPAYAQANSAVQGLQPILPIWRAFRNFIYIISSLFFITIGIMIILRVKISPQAVITIQNAIPQMIITLILVTFSYAIAGLILDLCNLFQGLIISTMFSGLGKSTTDSLLTPTAGQTNMATISKFFGGDYSAYSLTDLIAHNGFLQTFDLTSRLIPFTGIFLISMVITAIISLIFLVTPVGPAGALLTAGIGTGISVLILLILLIFILVKLIGLLFALIKAYVTIILKIILAPIEIGIGAFPGSKAGFSTWLTDLIANAAIFPVCIIFLVLANVIIESISRQGLITPLWTPPLMGLAGSVMTTQLVAGLFGIGAFLILSKLPDLVPQVIFALKPSPWGQAIGQGLSEAWKNPVVSMGRQVSLEAGANAMVNEYNVRQQKGSKQTFITSLFKPIVQAGIASGAVGERHKFEPKQK